VTNIEHLSYKFYNIPLNMHK